MTKVSVREAVAEVKGRTTMSKRGGIKVKVTSTPSRPRNLIKEGEEEAANNKALLAYDPEAFSDDDEDGD